MVGGLSKTARVTFCFGLIIGMVISLLLVSQVCVKVPKLMTKYGGDIDDVQKGSFLTMMAKDARHWNAQSQKHADVKIDNKVAKDLEKKIRVLCWVMTSPQNLNVKAIHVRNTWARRCNVVVFISSETDTSFPTVGLNVSEGREHLTAKTMKAFKYIFEKHFNDADWFMKADDDTYVILENLRYFLQTQSRDAPVYFGHHFKTLVKQGYYSGGAGYVLSKEALRRLNEEGRDPKVCRQDGGYEDVEIGKCMENLGVRTVNGTDSLGRTRFHVFEPEKHLFGRYQDWYYSYDSNGAKKGVESISDYAISFHYVPPEKMYVLEFYVYHLRPYGIEFGQQRINQVVTTLVK